MVRTRDQVKLNAWNHLSVYWHGYQLCIVCVRLDCGTGPGVVRTRDQVQLNAWNHLSVYRHDWGVWVQLNGGKQEEGRSQVRLD
jgi:hypothetical protein